SRKSLSRNTRPDRPEWHATAVQVVCSADRKEVRAQNVYSQQQLDRPVARSVPPSTEDRVRDECARPGEREHVGELERGPLPAAGRATHHGDGGSALEREREEDEECDGSAEGHGLLERFLECERSFVGALDAVDGAERSDDDLARGEG